MNKSKFLSLGVAAILIVFAVGCTTARGYEDMRYENRGYGYSPYSYYEPYGYYQSYPVIIDQRGRYYGSRYDDRRYYEDRRYNNNRRNNNQQYNNQKSAEQRRLEQQQYEQQKREDTRKIEQSRQSVLGNKKN